jgi:hypothetical protein
MCPGSFWLMMIVHGMCPQEASMSLHCGAGRRYLRRRTNVYEGHSYVR